MSLLVPAASVLPLGGAAILGGANRLLPRRARDLAALVIAAATTALAVSLVASSAGGTVVYWFSGWHPTAGIAIGVDYAVDPLGAGLAVLAGLLTSAALVYSWRFFDTVGGLYHALVLVFLAASVDFCLTGDLFNLFVAFELVAVTAYALTGYNSARRAPLQGAINFAVSNSLAGMVVLLGVGLLYTRTGSLNLAQIGNRLADHRADGLIVVAFALLTGGFLVKAAAVPFHFWLPDAYGTAPIPACVLFAGVMSELGLFAVARVWETMFSGLGGGTGPGLRAVLLAFGVATAVIGPVMALAQTNLKRMLAFLTMSHLGLYLIGFGLLSSLGLAGAALLAVGDGLAKAAMFFGVGILQQRRSSVSELRLRGKGASLPVAGAIVALGALVAADLPPSAAASGKDILVAAADQQGLGWLEAVVAFCVIVSSAAVLRASGRIWLGWGPAHDPPQQPDSDDDPGEEDSERPQRTPAAMMLPPIILLVVALAIGLVPDVAQRAADAAAAFTDRTAYAAAVLHGVRLPIPRLPAPPATAMSLLAGVGEAAGAVGLAAVALARHRRMATVRHVAAAAVEPLRRLHSGHVGDQVAWLITGLSLLAGAIGLALR
jgi:multicomponent Na+:H+ antiporter subunit D